MTTGEVGKVYYTSYDVTGLFLKPENRWLLQPRELVVTCTRISTSTKITANTVVPLALKLIESKDSILKSVVVDPRLGRVSLYATGNIITAGARTTSKARTTSEIVSSTPVRLLWPGVYAIKFKKLAGHAPEDVEVPRVRSLTPTLPGDPTCAKVLRILCVLNELLMHEAEHGGAVLLNSALKPGKLVGPSIN